MYAIFDKENAEYYSQTFGTREDAEDALDELCYSNEWEKQYFIVVRVPA